MRRSPFGERVAAVSGIGTSDGDQYPVAASRVQDQRPHRSTRSQRIPDSSEQGELLLVGVGKEMHAAPGDHAGDGGTE